MYQLDPVRGFRRASAGAQRFRGGSGRAPYTGFDCIPWNLSEKLGQPASARSQKIQLRGLRSMFRDKLLLFRVGSVSFYREDMHNLQPGEWLNDNNISLVYELLASWLAQQAFGSQLVLLYPALVQLVMHTEGNVAGLFPPEYAKLHFVFFPFNATEEDAALEEANNGDHWVLCVYSKVDQTLHVLDSMAAHDTLPFEQLARKIGKHVTVAHAKCQQQDNFDDCGVFLLMTTCHLVAGLMLGQAVSFSLEDVQLDPLAARVAMAEMVVALARHHS